MQKERKRLCLGSQGILARAIIVSVSLEALAGTTGLVAQSALGAAGFFGGSTLVVVGADVGVGTATVGKVHSEGRNTGDRCGCCGGQVHLVDSAGLPLSPVVGVVHKALNSFNCATNAEGSYLLQGDPNVDCKSQEWLWWYAVPSAAWLAVYFAIPACVLAWLNWTTHNI